jgi:hypothetical protein
MTGGDGPDTFVFGSNFGKDVITDFKPVLGPDIADMKRRPATAETVRLFNGPGNNGSTIRNGKTYNLKPGDVVIIPAGTGHWFTKIEDHISYVMVRIDPDKVTPLMDEAKSKEWLATPGNPTAPRGE